MSSIHMRRRWWREKSPLMTSGKAHDGAASLSSSTRRTTRSRRIRKAEANVRRWVADLHGGFDAGSGNHFDEELNSIGIDWHKQDDHEHDTYLSDLGRRIANTERAIAYAEDTVQQAGKDLGLAERNYESARARLSGESPSRTHWATGETEANALHSSNYQQRPLIPSQTSADSTGPPAYIRVENTNTRTPTTGGPNYREPHQLSGRSPRDMLMWLFVLFAVAADIAAFYSVLARLFRTGPVIIVAGTVGSTAAAIGICHLIGIGLQRRRSADRRRNDALLWTKVTAWLVLGGAAFLARFYFGGQSSYALQTTGSSSFGGAPAANVDSDLLAALFFAGLYLVSGLLAITASFNAFNPDAQAYRRAIRNLKDAARNVSSAKAQAKAQLAAQLRHQKVINAEQAGALERRKGAYRCTEADVARLKIRVRHLMAAELKDPKALDLLMKDAPEINQYPEPGRTS